MSIDSEFEGLLAGSDPAIHGLAHAVRDLVLAVHPRAYQEMHAGGGTIVFRQVADAGTTVCYLSVHKKHVALGLTQADAVPDPAALLEGSGNLTRHLKFKSMGDVRRPEVRALLEALWAMQPSPKMLLRALEEVRRICGGLPETSEKRSHGHPTFFAGKKSFAVFGLYSPSVAFKAGFELHAALEGDARIFPTPYMAQAGWLSVSIDPQTDWAQVGEFLVHSYRLVATPKLRAALDGEPRGRKRSSRAVR